MFQMRSVRFVAFACFPILAIYAQPIARPTLTVCELLRKPSQYNGKTISVRGVYFWGGHGLYLKGEDCDGVLVTKEQKWPALIWIEGSREQAELRGLNFEHSLQADAEITKAKFRMQREHGFYKPISKVTLTYTGLFETRNTFDGRIGKPRDHVPVEVGFWRQERRAGTIVRRFCERHRG
jgi:hypothetical protein